MQTHHSVHYHWMILEPNIAFKVFAIKVCKLVFAFLKPPIATTVNWIRY